LDDVEIYSWKVMVIVFWVLYKYAIPVIRYSL